MSDYSQLQTVEELQNQATHRQEQSQQQSCTSMTTRLCLLKETGFRTKSVSRHILSRIITSTENDMLRSSILAVLFVLFGNLPDADAEPMHDPTRGELLYTTNCIACHNAQVHWRDKKLVTDWTSLQSEVRRWQKFSGLGWSDDDIMKVARYLNALYYHYPTPD